MSDSLKTKASLKHRILACWMFSVHLQDKHVISLKEQTNKNQNARFKHIGKL
jgi:hypothetical protein